MLTPAYFTPDPAAGGLVLDEALGEGVVEVVDSDVVTVDKVNCADAACIRYYNRHNTWH